ncbi:MAG: hypothetical protein IPL21_07795 [Saprospirales bacterium]|nr:hypothetical protein [Saprospirales bacterium]
MKSSQQQKQSTFLTSGKGHSLWLNMILSFLKSFQRKKKVKVILITQQEFASQVKEEIPPILDDQQLLGVTVRVAKNEMIFFIH